MFPSLFSTRDLHRKFFKILPPVLATVELWRDKKSVVHVAECVAARVAINRLLTLFLNIYCFFDPSCVYAWFPVPNYRSLPIDHMVVMKCMVSQSWFVLFWQTWRPLASGERLVSYGFHFHLMFFQSCATFSPSLSYQSQLPHGIL